MAKCFSENVGFRINKYGYIQNVTCFTWCRTRLCLTVIVRKNAVASGVKLMVQNFCETPCYLPRHTDLSLKVLHFLLLVLTVLHYGAVYIEILGINCETNSLFHEHKKINSALRSRVLAKANMSLLYVATGTVLCVGVKLGR